MRKARYRAGHFGEDFVGLEDLGAAEVDHLECRVDGVLAKEDVFGLEVPERESQFVPVDDVHLVAVVYGREDLSQDVGGVGLREDPQGSERRQ
jgi:hypothetical protein